MTKKKTKTKIVKGWTVQSTHASKAGAHKKAKSLPGINKVKKVGVMFKVYHKQK